ncbi:type VI secretion system-associated FHA domain protein TagH [Thiohalocapsa marina]
MELILTVSSYNGQPPNRPASLRLSQGNCVLGRHPDCELELPDPECVVSGRHALIERQDTGYSITDISTNGTAVNDASAPIPPHQPVALHDGDCLIIGPYEISVAIASQDEGLPTAPLAPALGQGLPGMADARSTEDIMDLLGSGPGGAGAGPAKAARPASQTGQAPRLEAARPSVEDIHFDLPEMPPRTAPAQPDEREGTPGDDPFAVFPPAEQAPRPTTEPAAQPSAAKAMGEPQGQVPEGYDLLSDVFMPPETSALEAASRPAPEAEPPAAPETSPLIPDASDRHGGAEASGRETAPEMPPSPRAPASAPAQGAAAPSAELTAFLKGLGAPEVSEIRDPEAMLRTAGQLLRSMTEGLMAVMMARASFKSELRLEVTTIRARENNPFQFSVDPADALERLLWRPSHGFLDPATSARKSFEDIQAHQMAMIAGLRAALKALLARFDPQRIEQGLDDQSQIEKLLPIAHKSKCWDQFVAAYDQVAEDASEDFMRLFGDAFNQAYEEQVSRLAEAKRTDSD